MKKYRAVVFIGRFQPFHNAHLEIVRRAFELTDLLILVIGSQRKPVTFKNPFQVGDFSLGSAFYYEALGDTIRSIDPGSFCFDDEDEEKSTREYAFCFQEDIYGDQVWCGAIQEKVGEILGKSSLDSGEIGIIGCRKDETSYYLEMFPQWELIEVPILESLGATQIRDLYFVENPNMNFLKGVLPGPIYDYLNQEKGSEWHSRVVKERRFIEKYKSQYASLPWPPIFVTVDAVIFQSGHVLMVRRRSYPGMGLTALPGGFVDAVTDASLEDAMIREVKEETGLKVAPKILRGSIKGIQVFDSVDRSSRGRTITHAFNILLPDGELPKVRAGSDADKAFWVPFSMLNPADCFEDHYQIIQSFL